MHSWWHPEIGFVIFLGAAVLIALSNLWFLRRLSSYPEPPRFPRVSILLPARNEERNIVQCVHSLLAQDYPDYQVIVLDDESTDRTWELLQNLARGDNRLKVIKGEPLPEGWIGKHWACHQLAKVADGEFILFTDADTRHHPYALRDAMGAMFAEDADLLTIIPKEETRTFGERIIVPIVPWAVFSLLPVGLCHALRAPIFSLTIGQFMLLRKRAYDKVGGHGAVRGHAVDDVTLGRLIKANGMNWRMADGTDRVSCRMYWNFREAYEGFTKNVFAAFDYAIIPFFFVYFWLTLVFWVPIFHLLGGALGFVAPGSATGFNFLAILFSLLLWGVSCWRSGIPVYFVILYPVTIAIISWIALRSMVFAITGKATWKDRTLVKYRVRWW
ncbi:MAG: glycosyltransferase [candidate division WOR-3 bacterium]